MDKEEQIEFVNQLIENTKKQIIINLEKHELSEWNGIELRQYIADKFQEQCMGTSMGRKRKHEYNNTIIVKNL